MSKSSHIHVESDVQSHNLEAPVPELAMSNAVPATVPPAASPSGEPAVSEKGSRARRAFMMKQLLPDQDWIMKNVVAGGKGTRATVGRVWGICLEAVPKKNALPSGEMVDSIALQGSFQSESYLTGEMSDANAAYFPMSYAERVANVFKMDPSIKVVEVDCDIGLEATGKPIPYEWVVIAYREGAEMATLRKLRGSRARPEKLLLTSADRVK